MSSLSWFCSTVEDFIKNLWYSVKENLFGLMIPLGNSASCCVFLCCVCTDYHLLASGKATDCTEPWDKVEEVFTIILGAIPPHLIGFIFLQRPDKALWQSLSAVHEQAEIKMAECFRRCSKRSTVTSVTLILHLVKAGTGTKFCLAGKVCTW